MQIFNYIGMYVVYSVLFWFGLNWEKNISNINLLAMLSLGLFFLTPLSDLNNTMLIVPNTLFGFSLFGLLILIINVLTKSRDTEIKCIKIISVEQKFYRQKNNIIDSLLALSIFWFVLYLVANIIAPLIQNMSNMTNSMANQMSELTRNPVVINSLAFSYKHFYFIHLSILSGIFFIGSVLYFIKNKYFPSSDRAQLDPFIDLAKEKSRKSAIKEIPLNQMKKIISTSKFVLIRSSSRVLSQEEALIAKINEIHPIIFTSVMVDTMFKNRELFGVVYENNILRFYKIDRNYDAPPNSPTITKTEKDSRAEGVLTNA
jgi:hypothetical protein